MDLLATLASTAEDILSDKQPRDRKRKYSELHSVRSLSRFDDLPYHYANPLQLWGTCQHFYSHIDAPFFEENEFLVCLGVINRLDAKKLPKKAWGAVRRKIGREIGKPRRFSPAFLVSERDKLRAFREEIRNAQRNRLTYPVDGFPYRIPRSVTVGNKVIVCNLHTGFVGQGSVLSVVSARNASESTRYLVQFQQAELETSIFCDLDVQLVDNDSESVPCMNFFDRFSLNGRNDEAEFTMLEAVERVDRQGIAIHTGCVDEDAQRARKRKRSWSHTEAVFEAWQISQQAFDTKATASEDSHDKYDNKCLADSQFSQLSQLTQSSDGFVNEFEGPHVNVNNGKAGYLDKQTVSELKECSDVLARNWDVVYADAQKMVHKLIQNTSALSSLNPGISENHSRKAAKDVVDDVATRPHEKLELSEKLQVPIKVEKNGHQHPENGHHHNHTHRSNGHVYDDDDDSPVTDSCVTDSMTCLSSSSNMPTPLRSPSRGNSPIPSPRQDRTGTDGRTDTGTDGRTDTGTGTGQKHYTAAHVHEHADNASTDVHADSDSADNHTGENRKSANASDMAAKVVGMVTRTMACILFMHRGKEFNLPDHMDLHTLGAVMGSKICELHSFPGHEKSVGKVTSTAEVHVHADSVPREWLELLRTVSTSLSDVFSKLVGRHTHKRKHKHSETMSKRMKREGDYLAAPSGPLKGDRPPLKGTSEAGSSNDDVGIKQQSGCIETHTHTHIHTSSASNGRTHGDIAHNAHIGLAHDSSTPTRMDIQVGDNIGSGSGSASHGIKIEEPDQRAKKIGCDDATDIDENTSNSQSDCHLLQSSIVA
jgi:hypothetical protein